MTEDLNPSAMKNIPCKKCGGVLWMNTFKMKMYPAIITKSGRNEIKPAAFTVCFKCHADFTDNADVNNTVADREKTPGAFGD